MTRLVIAVGNPGRRYTWTRHNIGFLLADRLVEQLGGSSFKEVPRLFSSLSKVDMQDESIIFIKPKTFTNLSGRAALAVRRYYDVPLDNILVLADDVNHSLGILRLRQNGGSGGHKGIKSITECLGDNGYWQLRLGVGRPPEEKGKLADFVLGEFSDDEKEEIKKIFLDAEGLFSQWCSRC